MFAPKIVLTSSVAILLTLAGSAAADIIPDNFLTTEMMMENLGVNVQGIGRLLGIDDASPLHATTFTDPANLAFSFALDPGQTYAGSSVGLLGGGTYNAAQSRWEGHAVAAAGRTPLFTADWTCDVTSVDPFVGNYLWTAQVDTRRLELDAEGGLVLVPDGFGGILSYGYGALTINHQVVAAVVGFDWLPAPFFWGWTSSTPGFETGVTGFSDPSGGYGTATTTITPEPASLALLALGLLIRVGHRR